MILLKPNKLFSRITKIDLEFDIKRCGFRYVFLDVDNTILPRDTRKIPDDIVFWLENLKSSELNACLMSNSLKEGVDAMGRALELPVFTGSMKPLPLGFIRVFKKMGASNRNSILIGDQVFTDSLGAHLVGMKCYLVQPLSGVDLPFTLFLRKFENRVLKNVKLQG